MNAVVQTASGVTFRVRVTPRAGRTAFAGVRGESLLVRLAAAPVDGAANDALLAFLAEALRCPRRHLTIVSGERAREKVVRVASMEAASVSAKIREALGE